MLEPGMKAPEFTLPDKDGNPVSLSDFLGRRVVLYFYPKDSTPGCTRQALAYAGLNDEFAAKNAVVIGVSRDSAASHQRFAEKNALPFLLLCFPISWFVVSAINGFFLVGLLRAQNGGRVG